MVWRILAKRVPKQIYEVDGIVVEPLFEGFQRERERDCSFVATYPSSGERAIFLVSSPMKIQPYSIE
ncbi:MAG: hypothetical protein ACTSPZ_05670 [Promethearchaeota archaeon]